MITINNMINETDANKTNCCGCGACFQICPTNSISMIRDDEGFSYPEVNYSICIKCQKCIKICPVLQKEKLYQINNSIFPNAVGGWHRDQNVLEHSSSGGVFSLVAQYVLKNEGVVFGAAFDDNMSVKHISTQSEAGLDKIRGSKYVQSEIGTSYVEVKKYLNDKRVVFFTGTPCQVAGLFFFLEESYENLITADFICHGVPSPIVFKKYLSYLEQKEKSEIIDFKFRNKERDWKPSGQQQGTKVYFKNGKIKSFKPAYFDFFMNGFLSDLYLRPSCHQCAFKRIPKKYADITFADFWGVDRINKKLINPKGTSLLLINNEKGQKLFNTINHDFYYEKCDFQNSIRKNKCLFLSVTPSKNRNKFFKALYIKSFKYVMLRYMNPFQWALEVAKKMLKL